MPKVDELVKEISKYSSTVRLTSKALTARKLSGKMRSSILRLRLMESFISYLNPFIVINGVAAFQKTINKIIKEEGQHDTFTYMDNVTICGHDFSGHDQNLQRFLNASKKFSISFNDDKSAIAANTVCLLGYEISQGQLRPDPKRFQVQALINLTHHKT